MFSIVEEVLSSACADVAADHIVYFLTKINVLDIHRRIMEHRYYHYSYKNNL